MEQSLNETKVQVNMAYQHSYLKRGYVHIFSARVSVYSVSMQCTQHSKNTQETGNNGCHLFNLYLLLLTHTHILMIKKLDNTHNFINYQLKNGVGVCRFPFFDTNSNSSFQTLSNSRLCQTQAQ